jgi:hypothetical protein
MESKRVARDENAAPSSGLAGRYEAPSFELISLDCEITSYAPDGDLPLF